MRVRPGSARGSGRLVNFTRPSEPEIVNAVLAAKSAAHLWSKRLLRQIAVDGMTVNRLQPGRIRSEHMAKHHPTPENERELVGAEIPARRLGSGTLHLRRGAPLA